MSSRQFARLLADATHRLGNGDESRLEAELLLAYVCGCQRTYFRTWPEREPDPGQLDHFRDLLARRCGGEPLAYILGERDFWSLTLRVTPGVLIPRSDTERLVEAVLSGHPEPELRVADLGTGSGAIALALASERPGWRIMACDTSQAALDCAEANRRHAGLGNVVICRSDWCEALDTNALDLLVSNPPYIPVDDPHLQRGDLPREPREALASGVDGLDDIRQLAVQAMRPLRPGGWLYLEHGYDQATRVRDILAASGYEDIRTWCDLAGHERVTAGRRGHDG